MKFWTVQTKYVLDEIQDIGGFMPDFSQSRYLKMNEKLVDLYSVLLGSFNKVNHVNLQGLIFAFVQSDDNNIFSYSSYEDFKTSMIAKKAVVESLWNRFEKDSVVLELDYEDFFNPLFVDINDFQFLMPPILLLPPYTEKSVDRILDDFSAGQITRSELPSNIIQAHLPFIEKKNVTNVYPLFDLD